MVKKEVNNNFNTTYTMPFDEYSSHTKQVDQIHHRSIL
jgi:hypothetical protein